MYAAVEAAVADYYSVAAAVVADVVAAVVEPSSTTKFIFQAVNEQCT